MSWAAHADTAPANSNVVAAALVEEPRVFPRQLASASTEEMVGTSGAAAASSADGSAVCVAIGINSATIPVASNSIAEDEEEKEEEIPTVGIV